MIAAYSKTKHGNLKVSENFRVNEFACNDGTDPIFICRTLVFVLQKVREHFKKPVTINSGYRTPIYNAKVDGSPSSQHQYGRAADIVVQGVTPQEVYNYLCALLPDSGGIGLYDTFVHVDTRPSKSRWKG